MEGAAGRGGASRAENAEIGMYPVGYSTMERIDLLFNYVFREVTSTTTRALFVPMNLLEFHFGNSTAEPGEFETSHSR